eukprot:scaffold28530_cov73-Isochrysis_galbana.AAC.1
MVGQQLGGAVKRRASAGVFTVPGVAPGCSHATGGVADLPALRLSHRLIHTVDTVEGIERMMSAVLGDTGGGPGATGEASGDMGCEQSALLGIDAAPQIVPPRALLGIDAEWVDGVDGGGGEPVMQWLQLGCRGRAWLVDIPALTATRPAQEALAAALGVLFSSPRLLKARGGEGGEGN